MEQNENIEEVMNSLQHSTFNISFQKGLSESAFRSILSDHINSLIVHNFSLLVSILYRLDISEKKLKEILKQQPQTHAGSIISDLIIEKQLQKIESRKKYSRQEDIPPDEKW